MKRVIKFKSEQINVVYYQNAAPENNKLDE